MELSDEDLLVAKLKGHVSVHGLDESTIPKLLEFGFLEKVGDLYTANIDIELEGSQHIIVPGYLFFLKRGWDATK